MTAAEHIDLAILELTRAKVTIDTDPAFAHFRLNDARFQIASALVAVLPEFYDKRSMPVLKKIA